MLRTNWSSCLSSVDSDSTHDSRLASCGSILPHRRVTTDMDEWSVSLWICVPCSRMNVRTQLRPPASNTAPDSRVQMNSSTCNEKQPLQSLHRIFSHTQGLTLMHCSAKSLLVRDVISTTTSRLQIALMAPSTPTMRLVHSADTST